MNRPRRHIRKGIIVIVTRCYYMFSLRSFENIYSFTVASNFRHSSHSVCVTATDQGPRSQRRNFQNRRFEKKGRFSKGRGPRRDVPNQSRNAGSKGRFQKASESDVLQETFKDTKETHFQKMEIPVERFVY